MMAKVALVLAALFASASAFAPATLPSTAALRRVAGHSDRFARNAPTMMASEKELRDRIDTVKKTNKITEAMRRVAAAKVRKAQQAVLATRPFAETLQSVFKGLMTRVEGEDLDLSLLDKREVKKVTLVVMTGDRGLCGAYNSFGIKEVSAQGISVNVVCVGKKVAQCKRGVRRQE